MSTVQDLLNLKEKIRKAQKELDETEGALKQLRKQLEEKYKCKNKEEAEKKLLELNEKVKKLNKKLEDGLEALEEKCGDEE